MGLAIAVVLEARLVVQFLREPITTGEHLAQRGRRDVSKQGLEELLQPYIVSGLLYCLSMFGSCPYHWL